MIEYIKSPLNYTGGKYELLSQIIPLFPNDIKTFYDVFGGGFNVGINVKCDKVIYNDLLTPLSDMMSYFKSHTLDEILSHIKNRIKEYDLSKSNKEGFISFRDTYNKIKNPIDLYVLSCIRLVIC
jgi:adenine-specific DNA-methyltransferase